MVLRTDLVGVGIPPAAANLLADAIQGTDDGLTAAELAYLNITTLGTGAASKAVVLDAGEDYTWPATGVLTYGVLKDPAGTTLLSTAAEIDAACDVSTRGVAGGSTLTITAALHAGKIVKLDTATGTVCTLPAATGTMNVYRFATSALATSNSHIVKVANGTDVMSGSLNVTDNADGTVTAFGTVAASDTITLNRTTTGSVKIGGDFIEITDVAAGFFNVRGTVVATGAEATPFSATV